jgi:hypothetical protein
MLSELHQTEEKYCIIPLTNKIKSSNMQSQRIKMVTMGREELGRVRKWEM